MLSRLFFCQVDKKGCVYCQQNKFNQIEVISRDLAESWQLGPHLRRLFEKREGHICQGCGMSKRVRMLLWSIRRLFPGLSGLAVLHINQINHLSPALQPAARLVETFHDPALALGSEVNGLSNQDMTRLTFPDNQFDLAIHSETLEHIHDYSKALQEVERVLKPGGCQIYKVPLIHARTIRRRIGLDEMGREVQFLPQSVHGTIGEYPMVWEFGRDCLRQRAGKIFQIHYDNYWCNRTVFSIVEKKL